MVAPDYNPNGSCYKGYEGILCDTCSTGYSKSGLKCAPCPELVPNIIRLSAIGLIVIGGLVYLIRSTLLGAKETKNVTSIYLKILMNHLQLILMTASFNLQWPDKVQSLFGAVKPAADVSTQIFSFDCFLSAKVSASDSILKTFFVKLMLLSVLPFLLALCCFTFWILYSFCKRSARGYRGEMISSLVILLFLVHPSIVQYMFSNFTCQQIDD